MIHSISKFIRRWKFKKDIARVLERTAWELEANAAFETNIIPDLEKVKAAVEGEIKQAEEKSDSLKDSFKREDRDQRKQLEAKIQQLKTNIKHFETQIGNIKTTAQSNRQKAGEILRRRAFILKNF